MLGFQPHPNLAENISTAPISVNTIDNPVGAGLEIN